MSPFAGASTGSGGEIRDEGATGCGSKPKAGLTGFTVSNLRIPGATEAWEKDFGRPGRIVSALEIMLDGPCGVRIIPASSGTQSMVALSRAEHAGLIHAFSDIADSMDVLIVDTAAGISDSVVSFVRAAQECLVVVCNEPSSIADSYALMKLLHKEYGMHRFRVLPNMVRSPQEGSALFHKLEQVCERFLDVMLVQAGNIPYDDTVRKCIQRQRAVLDAAPRSRAAAAFRELAEKMDALPVSASASGHLEFFVERLLGGAAAG
jgi:flagellar biosynthesis protein FlhG